MSFQRQLLCFIRTSQCGPQIQLRISSLSISVSPIPNTACALDHLGFRRRNRKPISRSLTLVGGFAGVKKIPLHPLRSFIFSNTSSSQLNVQQITTTSQWSKPEIAFPVSRWLRGSLEIMSISPRNSARVSSSASQQLSVRQLSNS